MKLGFPVMGTSYTVNSYRVGDMEMLKRHLPCLCNMDLQSQGCQIHHLPLMLKTILFLFFFLFCHMKESQIPIKQTYQNNTEQNNR